MYVLKRIPSLAFAMLAITSIFCVSGALTAYAANPAFEQNTVWNDYDPADRRHYLVDAGLSASDASARKYKTLKEAAAYMTLDPIDGGPQEPEAVLFVANGTYGASNRFLPQYSRVGMPGYPNPRNGYSAVTSLAIIGQSQNGVIIDGGFTSAGERVSTLEDGVSGITITGKNITVKNLTVQNIKPGDGTGTTGSYANTSYGLLLHPLNNLAPVSIENCTFRYTPETRLAALKVWGMGVAMDDPTSGKYFGDKSNASVTVKDCDFDSLNIGIWMEENRGEILVADNSFHNLIPYGKTPGRGVRIYNQVHPSYTAAAGPGAGGEPLPYGTQTVQNCTFYLPYGGAAVMCDVGTPTGAGTSRSLLTVEALIAKDNLVNIVKGEAAVYNAIPADYARDATAFVARNLETNPLYSEQPSFGRIDIGNNTVNVSPEAAQSDFYSGQMLSGVSIAGRLSRLSGYGAVKVNGNTFRGPVFPVTLVEYSTAPGTTDSDDVDATHNLHSALNGNPVYEYRPLEGRYITITGSTASPFPVESYEPFFTDTAKSELSFEELLILDIYDANTNQKIQSSYAFDRTVKHYVIDDLAANVDSIYFMAWKVEKGTGTLLTHLGKIEAQQLVDGDNLIPVPSPVYYLTSGVETFVFDLSTVNQNPYKDENSRNRYTIEIRREVEEILPAPVVEPTRHGLNSYTEPAPQELVTIVENEVPLAVDEEAPRTINPWTGLPERRMLAYLCAFIPACAAYRLIAIRNANRKRGKS